MQMLEVMWTVALGAGVDSGWRQPGPHVCVDVLTVQGQGHWQQHRLLQALMLHFAGDILAVVLARGHQGEEAGDRVRAPWVLGLIGGDVLV
jgi:hypothetical protein